MGRRRKGPRTASGRLSRAFKGEARDTGTPEANAKRSYLINGADPALAACTSGILHANGILSRAQYDAAMRYARAHALTWGKVWPASCLLGDRTGGAAPDDVLARAKAQLEAMNALLDPAQRTAISNVAIFGYIPPWFFAERGIGRTLATDQADRAALLSGLEAIVRT